jgi:hypothetical protein
MLHLLYIIRLACAVPVWVPVPGSGPVQLAASGVSLFWEPCQPPLAPQTQKSLPKVGTNPPKGALSLYGALPWKQSDPATPGMSMWLYGVSSTALRMFETASSKSSRLPSRLKRDSSTFPRLSSRLGLSGWPSGVSSTALHMFETASSKSSRLPSHSKRR